MFLSVMALPMVLIWVDVHGLGGLLFSCVGKDDLIILPSLIWGTAITVAKKRTKGYNGRQNQARVL